MLKNHQKWETVAQSFDWLWKHRLLNVKPIYEEKKRKSQIG